MKIVYLHQYFKTPKENGGVRSYHFARALAASGHDVHIVTSDSSGDARDGHVQDVVDGIYVHRIAVAYDNSMGTRDRVLAFVRFALASARVARGLRGDAVVATSTPLTIAIPALWATAARRRTRFIFEVRDLWPDVPIAMGYLNNPLVIAAARWLERRAYARADRIVALSAGMASGVVRAGGTESKVVVIPNIADVEAFGSVDTASPTLLDDLGIPDGRPLVLYCGTFGRVNGLSYMVDLAAEAQSRGSSLVFAAVGTGAEREAVIEYARQRDVLGKNFFALDPVSKSELPGLLARATFGSSWVIDVEALEHNSANKFFDTLASGRPMLVNHGGWQAEVLQATGAGWQLSRDAREAVELLDRVSKDPVTLARAGSMARQTAVERYSLPVLAELFVETVTGS
jgi:glycosyltransferase involved in cell wall biosynthesis